MMKRLKQNMKSDLPTNWPHLPSIVGVRSIINDTEIPSVYFHSQDEELSCNWRGMFTALLSECKLYTKLMANCVCALLLNILHITKPCIAQGG